MMPKEVCILNCFRRKLHVYKYYMG